MYIVYDSISQTVGRDPLLGRKAMSIGSP